MVISKPNLILTPRETNKNKKCRKGTGKTCVATSQKPTLKNFLLKENFIKPIFKGTVS
jgi:hypothetical protein